MRDAGEPTLLKVDIARKRYADADVIAGLSLSLQRGSVTCLLGPSGCGKTTALRILLGLDTCFEGHIAPPIATLRLGVVFQDPRLLPWRTVEENVRLAAPAARPETLNRVFDELALTPWRRHWPGQLSGGLARRAALARALAVEPDLLVLDEPFVSLDEKGADELRATVFAAVRARGTTVLMVTHNMREALQHADVVLTMAPRPTRVLRRTRFDVTPEERDEAWLARGRDLLLPNAP